jgi:hypothetical protein
VRSSFPSNWKGTRPSFRFDSTFSWTASTNRYESLLVSAPIGLNALRAATSAVLSGLRPSSVKYPSDRASSS